MVAAFAEPFGGPDYGGDTYNDIQWSQNIDQRWERVLNPVEESYEYESYCPYCE
jgi:hypothetical protein